MTHDITDGFYALFVAQRTGKMLFLRPAAITVHDDGNMARAMSTAPAGLGIGGLNGPRL
jgi:hypothetical protein